MGSAQGLRAWSSRLQRALAGAARLAFVSIVGFHAWRFVAQAFEGQLLAPDVALRWGAGLALLAGFVALRRVGVPVLRGRKAAVLWTLVFLLHWHAAVSKPLAPSGHPVIPESAEAAAAFSAGAAILVGAVILWAAVTTRPDRRQRVVGWVTPGPGPSGLALGYVLCLAPRPPPA